MTDSAETSADKPAPNLMVERLKFLAIGLGVGLVIGGAGAGYVWFNGQAEITQLQTEASSELEKAHDSAKELQASLDKELEKGAVLGSRVEIARARQSLEQMNYGLVTQRLSVAAQRLDGIERAAPIVSRLKSIQVDPMAPETARALIDSAAGEVDELIGR